MNPLVIRPSTPDGPTLQSEWFEQLADATLRQVAPSSARVYGQTYTRWVAWCLDEQLDPFDLRPAHVLTFLGAQPVAKSTRQRQLSALRKLTQMLYILAPSEETRRMADALTMIKVPAGGETGTERPKRALAPSQADKVLRVWDEQTNRHKRNAALIAVMALGALRRSEATALRWQDVDFDNGVITVRHGKGDKHREVPLAGDFALEALRTWRMCHEMSREFIFCAVNKGDNLCGDKPISGTDVYRVVKETEALSGVEFKPHDLRRTFITEALATGTPLATVQAAAGHARGETTLRYAQAVDARTARKALKLRYG
jgi:integrase